MFQALLLHRQHGFGGLHFGFGGLLGGEVLVDLLAAQRPGGLQRARALGVAAGVLCIGLCLQQTGAGLRHVGLHALGCKSCQHLARAHHVADIGAHRQQTQAVGLTAHNGLLPGRNVAIGAELVGQIALLGLDGGHREGRFGWRHPGIVCSVRLGRQKADSQRGYYIHCYYMRSI